ncbi:MAG: SDR family NAD(P)-dependent oxidoreductase, partial [Chloroflexi bacterium]|nr:SDR family NAD(P)-dependent oxidoreductase [Chloroflexota bacterium]
MPTDYVNELFSVQDKVVVITGGGGILCSAMAHALAKAGARVAVLDIMDAAAQRTADEIVAAGGVAK